MNEYLIPLMLTCTCDGSHFKIKFPPYASYTSLGYDQIVDDSNRMMEIGHGCFEIVRTNAITVRISPKKKSTWKPPLIERVKNFLRGILQVKR